jgi:hypothetical protein
MGSGNLRNKLCPCGSGKKFKLCCGLRKSINIPKDIKYIEKEIDGEKFVFKGLSIYSMDSVDKNEDEHEEKSWYRPLCSEAQISRIFNIKSTSDYLLKVRADSILENMRLYRVMMSKLNNSKGFWNFQNEYNDIEFNKYLECLKEEDFRKCLLIQKGYVHSDDPNGHCMRTPYGDIIIISESLRHFLYYMNLHTLDFGYDIPGDIRYAALMIALRVMLQTESMDFELDPRGNVPKEIDELNKFWVNEQLQFVIGHEFSHNLLGHLDKNNINERSLYSLGLINSKNSYKFYNNSQEQEFEADVKSIIIPKYPKAIFDEKVNAAIFFFKYLDIFEYVKENIFPSMSRIKTHPDPIDRIWNIFQNTEENLNRITKDYINNLVVENQLIKDFLSDDIGYNIEKYENYGSVYLGKWKEKMLKDRIDY